MSCPIIDFASIRESLELVTANHGKRVVSVSSIEVGLENSQEGDSVYKR